MKIGELITMLQATIAEHGDVDVTFPADTRETDEVDSCHVAGVSVLSDESEKPLSVMLCDQETMLAFS